MPVPVAPPTGRQQGTPALRRPDCPGASIANPSPGGKGWSARIATVQYATDAPTPRSALARGKDRGRSDLGGKC